MSEPKRPGGSRDISDLKARLGLKKGGAPTTGQQSTRANGGVVAPPGLNLPPPPGIAQPAQPVIPNAADDPFGAMNAMAAVGTVQRAPEIVVVTHDGKAIESVAHRSTGQLLALIGIPAVLFGGIGYFVGGIIKDRGIKHDAVANAKDILGDKNTPSTVAQLKQTLSQIDTTLDEARTKNQFRPDAATDKKLEALVQKLDIKADIVYGKTATIDGEVASQVLKFYSGVAEVKSMLDAHLKFAKSDDNAFTKAKKGQEDASLKDGENAPLAGQLKYAVVIQAPTETEKNVDFGAKIIELGGVYCGTSNVATSKCPEGENPTGVQYRTDLEKNPIKGDLASPSTDSVPTKKIVTLLPGTIRDQFFKGAEGVASEVYYQRRLRTVYELICKRENDGKCNSSTLIELGNRVEQKLEGLK